ncbi:MAG: MauE/DoxX family redox-associated membrane protein [Actinomycetes bacterium]
MGPWTVPYGIAVTLLVVAGVAKVAEPRDSVGALARSGLVVPAVIVRIVAAFEVGLGTAAVVGGTRTAAGVVALSYLAFTAFVVQALVRRLPIGSCGCFGRVDTPPSAGHVAVNLGCALAAVGAAASGPAPWLGLPDVDATTAIATVVLVLVGTALAAALLTVVPRALAARG